MLITLNSRTINTDWTTLKIGDMFLRICFLHFIVICKPFIEKLNCNFGQSSSKDGYRVNSLWNFWLNTQNAIRVLT